MSAAGARPLPPAPVLTTPGKSPPPPPPVGWSNGTYSARDERTSAGPPALDRVLKSRFSNKRGRHLGNPRSVLTLLHPLTIATLLVFALVLGIAIGRAGTQNVEPSGASRERLAYVIDVVEVLLDETSGNEKALQEIREKLANRRTADRQLISAKQQGNHKESEGAKHQGNHKESGGASRRSRPGARVGDSSGKASRSESKVIAAYEGDRPRSVPLFTAKKPWRVAWSGDDVFFFIRAENGRLIHGDGGSGRGSYVVRRSGRFYLEVIASADWTLKVERA
jgi:hypothetical protein